MLLPVLDIPPPLPPVAPPVASRLRTTLLLMSAPQSWPAAAAAPFGGSGVTGTGGRAATAAARFVHVSCTAGFSECARCQLVPRSCPASSCRCALQDTSEGTSALDLLLLRPALPTRLLPPAATLLLGVTATTEAPASLSQPDGDDKRQPVSGAVPAALSVLSSHQSASAHT
jgi:hypothetical protein